VESAFHGARELLKNIKEKRHKRQSPRSPIPPGLETKGPNELQSRLRHEDDVNIRAEIHPGVQKEESDGLQSRLRYVQDVKDLDNLVQVDDGRLAVASTSDRLANMISSCKSKGPTLSTGYKDAD
jgi:hypothetical protein